MSPSPTAATNTASPRETRTDAPQRERRHGDERRTTSSGRQRRPPEVGVAGGVHRHEVAAEPDRREQCEPDARGDAPLSLLVLARRERDAGERQHDADDLQRRGPVAGREPDRRPARPRRGRRSERRRSSRRPPSRGSRRRARAFRRGRPGSRAGRRLRPVPRRGSRRRRRSRPGPRSGREQDAKRAEHASLERPEEVREAPREARAEGECGGLSGNRPRRGDRVELVRVVEHGRLRGARRAGVVVRGDRVQQLPPARPRPSSSRRRPRCTWPSSVPSSVGRKAGGGPSSRVRPTSCTSAAASEQVGAQARVQLRQLAADRRDADGVLEQPAGVRVMPLRRRRDRRAAARPRARA